MAKAFTLLVASIVLWFVADAQPPPPYATVAFQWPMSLCRVSPCQPEKLKPLRFSLQGVWPSDGEHRPITNCPTSIHWIFSALNALRNDLTLYWPSFTKTTNLLYWHRQWLKHGSCMGMSVYDYFHSSLTLFKDEYDGIFKALARHDMHPSSNLNDWIFVPSIHDAIVSELQLVPFIRCERDYLVEIRLCATMDLKKFQNCTSAHVLDHFIGCRTHARFYKDP